MPRPIPSLREQLLCIHVGGPAIISGDHYGLLMSIINKLEILAEKVEALEERQEPCGITDETSHRIRALEAAVRGYESQHVPVADDKEEIESLRKERDEAKATKAEAIEDTIMWRNRTRSPYPAKHK